MTNIYFGLQTGKPSRPLSLSQLSFLTALKDISGIALMRIGWVSMMSLQSALLGFAIFRLLPTFLPTFFKAPFTPQENVILQTTAVATGTMPLAAGLVGIIPALGMMTQEEDGRDGIQLGYGSLVLWCLAVAFFG